MNLLFRILAAFYAFISIICMGFIMISPFGDKTLLGDVLDYIHLTFYQSNKYDVLMFIVGFVFFCLNVFVLFSGIRGKKVIKYISTKNDSGEIRISSHSVENIALALSRRFQGIKDSKAKVHFRNDKVYISVRVTALPEAKLPELCSAMQGRIKESVESTMGLFVEDIKVSVDGVYTGSSQD
ncbi:MAG: alkaline shock response membrane anchor protein AmaP [Clostridiales bacterium]|jgi:uncharacterized alkaline shock family protein YloU|nr:alkaline shock response membrane anchor protein AmaP [Clostridiales bacterium]